MQKKHTIVTTGTINRINNGESWKEEKEKYPLYKKPIENDILKIIFDIENTNLTLKEIGEKYNLSKSAIVNINQGNIKLVKEYRNNFPLRKNKNLSEEQIKIIVPLIKKDLKNTKLKFTQIAEKYNVSRFVITNINLGRTYFIEKENYPIRPRSH